MTTTPQPAELIWESADSDEPGDQHADSAIVPPGCTSAYWSVGPAVYADEPAWSAELVGVSHGEAVDGAGADLGRHFFTETDAKAAAQAHESAARITP